MDDAFRSWFAGFVDGEGCFEIHKQTRKGNYSCRLTIKLRADDREVLEHIVAVTGIGRVAHHRANPDGRKSADQVYWQALTKPECLTLIEIFDRFPLRSKKARDFDIWRKAVMVWSEAIPTSQPGKNMGVWACMGGLQVRLREGRAFRTSIAA